MRHKKRMALGIALSLLLVSGVTAGFATAPIEEDAPQYSGNEILIIEPEDEGFLPVSYSYGNEEETGHIFLETELDDDTNGIAPQSVNESTNFTVDVGKSFIRKFKMGVLFADPHTAFAVRVTDTNGVPYKVIIVNTEGYERVTAERTGPTALTVINTSDTAEYTFYILNTGTKALTGHVAISSYYN